ncbi:MAG: TolC family protein [Williamsia sp.]|nr:TolC family protein [Williamsia sp.]
MKHKILAWLVLSLLVSTALFSQDVWSLQRSVEYAIANNISVKQANIAYEQAALDFRSNYASVYPTAAFSNNWGMRFGRSENPTTGILENTTALTTSFSFTSSFTIFNFYSLRNSVAAARYQREAAVASEERAKNDIGLRVANAYLLALQAKEQVRVSELQIGLTREQLDVTRKRVEAGSLPELNVAEIEAQLATDSSNLVSATANRELQLLQLKAVLNLDAGIPFDVETPNLDKIPVEPLGSLQPETVFNLAMNNLPQLKVDNLNVLAAQKNYAAARGQMYPRLTGFVNLATNFYAALQQSIGSASGFRETGLFARQGATDIPVYSPVFTGKSVSKPFGQIWKGFGSQMNHNFGQNLGIGINVPIFNGLQFRTNWDRARLTLRGQQLQLELDRQTLKQDVYTAYNNAIAALQKQVASKKAVETAQRSYELSKKRYDVNLLTSFELITNQNNLLRAQIDYLLARYDYVFKMKVLEFYKGQGLKLF